MHYEYERPWLYRQQYEAIFDPKDYQGNPARYSFIEASTKTGKTVGNAAWLFEKALMDPGPHHNYWWVAPIYGQAKIAYTRVKHGVSAGIIDTHEGDLRLTLPNSNIIWFKGAETPDSLFGEDVYAAVLDEASRMREQSFYAVRSTLTATQGPMRIIGNLKGRKNWFYSMSRKAQAGEPGMSYHKLTAYDAVDAGILAREEVEDAKRLLPDHVFKELYLAEPSDDGGNPFGLSNIAACVRPLTAKRPVAWGWDLAKSVDWTVGIGLDEDGSACRFERWQHRPWEQTIKDIKRITGLVPGLVDSTGVGDPILEALQANNGRNFEGYHFTGPSKQKLMEGLAVGIQSREVFFPEGPVRLEMEAFEYVYTRTGVRYSAPAGYHDDCVCSVALAHQCRTHNQAGAIWAKLGRMV